MLTCGRRTLRRDHDLLNDTSAIEFDRGSRSAALVDPFRRAITYLRVSVTDRCDFRCVYCMSEHMTFLPKADLLTPRRARPAVQRLRRQGRRQAAPDRRRAAGPPRHHDLVSRRCRAILQSGALKELTLTTNGSQLREIRRRARDAAASSASTCRSTRSMPTNSAPSRAGAISTRCMAGIDAAQARRPQGQDQRGRAQGRERGRDRRSDASGRTAAAWI